MSKKQKPSTKEILKNAWLKIQPSRFFKTLSNISIRRLLLILLPPTILSWPLLGSSPFPFQPKASFEPLNPDVTINQNSSTPKTIPFAGNALPMGSLPFISQLLNVRLLSTPTELCLHNNSEMFDENKKKIEPTELIDGEHAGLITLKLFNNNEVSDQYGLYIGKDDCKILPSEKPSLDNSLEIRNPIPLKVKTEEKDGMTTVGLVPRIVNLKIDLTVTAFRIKWQWDIFIINFLLLITAWWILLSGTLKMWNFINLKKTD